MSVRRNWLFGGCAVAVLALMGSCLNDAPNETASSRASASSSAQPPVSLEDQDVWVGRVVSNPAISLTPQLVIQLYDGTEHTVETAHTSRLYCRGSGELEAIDLRLRELAPIGSTVTFVRGVSSGFFGSDNDEGFIHLAETGRDATVNPYGPSVNETLLAEGRVNLVDPSVNLSTLTGRSVADEVAVQYDRPPDESPNREYWPVLLAAYQQAWDGRVNIQSDCRNADDVLILQRNQRDELDRIRRGPDGLYGTDDDDKNSYDFDADGSLRLNIPEYSSNGGSSSSGGGWNPGGRGFCRSRWC